MEIAALISFIALIVAWMALPGGEPVAVPVSKPRTQPVSA